MKTGKSVLFEHVNMFLGINSTITEIVQIVRTVMCRTKKVFNAVLQDFQGATVSVGPALAKFFVVTLTP